MYYGCTYLNYINLFIHYPILVLPRVISTNTSAHFFLLKATSKACVFVHVCQLILYKLPIFTLVFSYCLQTWHR